MAESLETMHSTMRELMRRKVNTGRGDIKNLIDAVNSAAASMTECFDGNRHEAFARHLRVLHTLACDMQQVVAFHNGVIDCDQMMARLWGEPSRD